MPNSLAKHGEGHVKMAAAAALTSGQVIQTPDSRAAAYAGMRACASGDWVTLYTEGVKTVTKTASVAILQGQEVWWDVTNNAATYRLAGDFYVGVCTATAAASDSTVDVALNVAPSYVADTAQKTGELATASSLGLGVVEAIGGELTLAFDAVAEIAMAAVYGSGRSVNVSERPIFEAEVAVYDIGDNAALDINFGLADGTHATDFDSVSDYVAFHLDGTDLTFKTQSDDTSAPVSADDSGVDAVDDTYFFAQIDATDADDVKFYIDGVQLNSSATFILTASTADLVPILHLEKTSDDTTADVRLRRMTLRSAVSA
jgi:predicted RecA/RadA family phage recombinase